MKQKPKRRRSVIVRLAVLCVSVYMIATLISLGNKLTELKTEYNSLAKYRDSLNITIQEYQDLLSSDSHAKIIEKAARERLGYVFPNEEIYFDY